MEEEIQKRHRKYLQEHASRRYRINITEDTVDSSPWELDYQDSKYNNDINWIEINPNEVVGELDEESKITKGKKSTQEERERWFNQAIQKLKAESVNYCRYCHKGKCDHTHIELNRSATPEEKIAILRYYFPKESWEYIDKGLCGVHMIACPFSTHWKYGTIKELVEENSGIIINVDNEKFKEFVEEDKIKEQTSHNFSNSGVTAEIVKNIKISTIAEEHGAKKGKGTKNYHCNFHDDKHPSLSLDDKKGLYKCHADSCGKQGNIVDFLAEAEHISREEALKILIERAGLTINNSDTKTGNTNLLDIKNKIANLVINEPNKKSEIHKFLKEIINLDDLETEDLLEGLHKKTNYKVSVLKKILNKYRKRDKENKKIAEKLKGNIKHYDRTELKKIILMLLLQGEMQQATEILCQEIQEKEHIHTTRDDEKSEVWIYQDGIYIPNGKTYIKEFCRLVLEESYSAYLANLVISKIEVDTYIEAKEFFKESPVEEIPVKNGILNIFTKTLSPFTPEKRFFTKIPINYIPLTDCPMIKKFLNQIHKHEEDVVVVQEFFGYCLLRDYRIEKAIMLTGDGRNGKGRELEILKRFLGPENCVNIQLQDVEKDSFALSELHGKLANISGDISKEAISNSGNFKMITGMDVITANRKFKIRISFLNYAKQIYSANEIPQTYDLTDAFFSRWVLLEYPFKFISQKELDKLSEEEKAIKVEGRPRYNLADKEIVSKITTDEELSGLLNWTLEGLSRLLQQRDFSYSKSMSEVKDMWLRKSDSFQAFCLDEIEQQYNGLITKEELRQRYSDYCKIHNVTAVGDKAIKETLNRKYGATDSQRTVYIGGNLNDKKLSYIWEGIKFKDDKTTQN